jgi:hypothetical protein
MAEFLTIALPWTEEIPEDRIRRILMVLICGYVAQAV